MNTTIDHGGRVVVPKALRNQLGLVPGMTLEVTVQDGTLLLSPAPIPMKLVRRGRGLVAVPDEDVPPLTTDAVRKAIEGQRR